MPTYPPAGDKLIGKVKRALGELTGRPDLVLDGEAQDTGLPREDRADAARQGPAQAGPDGDRD